MISTGITLGRTWLMNPAKRISPKQWQLQNRFSTVLLNIYRYNCNESGIHISCLFIVHVTHSFSPQGPCTGNQQSLAHSRLWDAIVGFLHVFAHMMMKLAQVRTNRSLDYILQVKIMICCRRVKLKETQTQCCFSATSRLDWGSRP